MAVSWHTTPISFLLRKWLSSVLAIIPTTINAISVDRENWQNSQLDQDFGKRASRLADAYVQMGVKPTFTCAPYLLTDKPQLGENIGWSESNAVIFANTVLGARVPKTSRLSRSIHRDDGTGASWQAYSTLGRKARIKIEVAIPQKWTSDDEVLWPLIGWLAGKLSPDAVPLITGLESLSPTIDDFHPLCAALEQLPAPMLHILGQTPESSSQNCEQYPIHLINQRTSQGCLV